MTDDSHMHTTCLQLLGMDVQSHCGGIDCEQLTYPDGTGHGCITVTAKQANI